MSRVELWVERRDGRPAVNPVMARLVDALGRLGHPVQVVVPEDRLVDDGAGPDGPPDLVLLKTTTPLALSAAVVAAVGTRVLNDADASAALADKAFTLARVAAAGVPVPATLLLPDSPDGSSGVLVPAGARLPAASRGWVRKPVGGVHGWGVTTHAGLSAAMTAATDGTDAPAGAVRGSVLVQERVGEDPDVKVYAVGHRLFATRKRFARTSFASDEIEPVGLTGDERDAVVAAGEACGLRLYGVDLRRPDAGRDDPAAGPAVVDVNAFPGYRGFAAAVPALVDEVLAELGRA